jgi:hypothetical protein
MHGKDVIEAVVDNEEIATLQPSQASPPEVNTRFFETDELGRFPSFSSTTEAPSLLIDPERA